MKKHLSILSLAVLLIYNSIYTAGFGKPLTAQEKIRANTLLVRQKHLNVDIQRFKDQGKNVPASMTKDFMNITNAINAYELRDPIAVKDIRKGFTPAVHTPVKPSTSTPKPAKKIPTATDLLLEKSGSETEEKKEEELVLEEKVLKDNKLDPAIIKEIEELATPSDKRSRIDAVLLQLATELIVSDLSREIQDDIFGEAKDQLDSLLEAPATIPLHPAKEPSLIPVPSGVERPGSVKEPKFLKEDGQINVKAVEREQEKITKLSTLADKKAALGGILNKLFTELKGTASLSEDAKRNIYNNVSDQLTLLLEASTSKKTSTPPAPISSKEEEPIIKESKLLKDGELKPEIIESIRKLPTREAQQKKIDELSKTLADEIKEALHTSASLNIHKETIDKLKLLLKDPTTSLHPLPTPVSPEAKKESSKTIPSSTEKPISKDLFIVGSKINPEIKQIILDRINEMPNLATKRLALTNLKAQLSAELGASSLPDDTKSVIEKDVSQIFKALESEIPKRDVKVAIELNDLQKILDKDTSTPPKPTAPIGKPAIEKPRLVPAPSPVLEAKSIESNVKWDNLDAFIAKDEDPLNRTNLTDRIINPQWQKNAFNAITKDLFANLGIPKNGNPKKDIQKEAIKSSNDFFRNKKYEKHVISILFKKIKGRINALNPSAFNQIQKNRYSERALTELIDGVVNDLYSKDREKRSKELVEQTKDLLPATTST